MTPGALLIAVLWGVGLLLVRRAGQGLPWHEGGDAPGGQDKPRGHSKATKENQATKHGDSTARTATVFGVAALVTLVAGVLIERSGEELFGRLGMSGVVFGATVLAAATSLPELSTGLTSSRMGDYQLAIGDIFGGNAFLPVLFLVATVLSGQAVLPSAHASDIYLTALGGLLTVIYMAGPGVPAPTPVAADGAGLAHRARGLRARYRGPRLRQRLRAPARSPPLLRVEPAHHDDMRHRQRREHRQVRRDEGLPAAGRGPQRQDRSRRGRRGQRRRPGETQQGRPQPARRQVGGVGRVLGEQPGRVPAAVPRAEVGTEEHGRGDEDCRHAQQPELGGGSPLRAGDPDGGSHRHESQDGGLAGAARRGRQQARSIPARRGR